MRMAEGGLVRTTSGLNLRVGAGTKHSSVAVVQKDVLLHVLGLPTSGGWVEVALMGWAEDGDPQKVYSEPDVRSSLDASFSLLKSAFVTEVRREGTWRELRVVGFVSTGFVVVVDGPG